MHGTKYMLSLFSLLSITFLSIFFSSCGTSGEVRGEEETQSIAQSSQVGDQEVIDAQNKGLSKVHVTFSATVYKLLPDDTKGIPHQRFLLRLSNNTTVLIAHNTNLGTYLNIKPGDVVDVSGEYIWNKKGGLVHYTHPATSTFRQGGFIKVRTGVN